MTPCIMTKFRRHWELTAAADIQNLLAFTAWRHLSTSSGSSINWSVFFSLFISPRTRATNASQETIISKKNHALQRATCPCNATVPLCPFLLLPMSLCLMSVLNYSARWFCLATPIVRSSALATPTLPYVPSQLPPSMTSPCNARCPVT